ncbi:hypothetical protein ACVXG9_01275 [Escherichia coli]
MEALAFAWLAWRTLADYRKSAFRHWRKQETVLGAIFPLTRDIRVN